MSRWLAYIGLLALSLNSQAAFAAEQALVPPEATPPGAAAKSPAPSEESTIGEGEAAGAEDGEDADKPHKYSFGEAPASLMYTPEQITAMKNVLIAFEARSVKSSSSAADTSNNQDILQFLNTKPSAVTGEPMIYPVFYLSSIFYHDPTDWMVWVNGQRITPKTNKPPFEVTAISPGAASFRWKPDFMPSLARRQQENKFAKVDAVKNRLTTRETVAFDGKENAITFTLNPNQSFSAAYMSTFEGKVIPLELEPLDAVAAAAKGAGGDKDKLSNSAKAVLDDMAGDGGAAPAPAAPAAPMLGNIDPSTVSTLQQLIKSQKSIMSAVPHNMPAQPESP